MKIRMSSDAGLYSLTFQGITSQMDGYSEGADACYIPFQMNNLDYGLYAISVNLLGVSPQALVTSSGSFEIENFM